MSQHIAANLNHTDPTGHDADMRANPEPAEREAHISLLLSRVERLSKSIRYHAGLDELPKRTWGPVLTVPTKEEIAEEIASIARLAQEL